MKTILIIATLAVLATANFTDHKVYRVHPKNQHELDLVRNFEDMEGIDFWSKIRQPNNDIDIMVALKAQGQFLNVLDRNGIAYSELISNVETVIQRERMTNMLRSRLARGNVSFDKYHRYDEILDYLQRLEQDYSDLVSVSSIGQSSLGRDVALIKISSGGSNKPIILIDGTIHAREWIAPAMVLYIINQLVENEANRHMIENVDWYIIPVLNVDGYEHTHADTANRFWRKTRSQGKYCVGVDANRNFDFHWMETGASSNECSDTYAGPRGFSEPEARGLKALVEEFGDRIKLYLTFHSYGQYLLYPWGYTSDLPENWRELDTLAHKVGKAISDVDGTEYTIGSSTNVLYAAAGGSDDWVKGVGGVPLAYTIELPGGGWNGFDPPASDIKGIVTETWQGVKVYHQYIDNKY